MHLIFISEAASLRPLVTSGPKLLIVYLHVSPACISLPTSTPITYTSAEQRYAMVTL